MICFDTYLAEIEIYSWDTICILTINIKPKSEKIVSFDGKVSLRYERSDLDIDDTYFTRNRLYTASFYVNNGKLTKTNANNLKIPNLSYIEIDKNERLSSLRNLSGTALKNFADKYSKINITAILPETSIDVLVKK